MMQIQQKFYEMIHEKVNKLEKDIKELKSD